MNKKSKGSKFGKVRAARKALEKAEEDHKNKELVKDAKGKVSDQPKVEKVSNLRSNTVDE